MARPNARRQQKARDRTRSKRKQANLVRAHRSTEGSRIAQMKRAGSLPLRDCLIGAGWETSRLATIVVSRTKPNGRVAVGSFLVDLDCLGVKNSWCNDDLPQHEYQSYIARTAESHGSLEPRDLDHAALIIQKSVEFASNLGFQPDKAYEWVRLILGDADPSNSTETFDCGQDGKPHYFAGPRDDAQAIIAKLTARLGSDGFHFTAPVDALE